MPDERKVSPIQVKSAKVFVDQLNGKVYNYIPLKGKLRQVILRDEVVIQPEFSFLERQFFYVKQLDWSRVVDIGLVILGSTPIGRVLQATKLLTEDGMPGVTGTSNIKEKSSTGLGVAAILAAVVSVLNALSDGDPTTNPDWATVISSVIAGASLIFASFKKK